MISFQEICEVFTLRHLARPRPALSTEVEKVTKNRLGSPQINLYVGPCWPTERKKNHETGHYQGSGHGLREDLVLYQVPLEVLLLPHPLHRLSPDEPDDPGSNELRVAAKECIDPTELPLLLGGEPGEPGKGVVDQG